MSSRPKRWMDWTTLLLVPFATGCIIGDDRCGKGEVRYNAGLFAACVCDEGLVPSPDNTRCVPCTGVFEEASNGACQCIAGYKKSAGVCAPMTDAGTDAGMSGGPLTGNAGENDKCTSSAECTKDATWCLTFMSANVCMVQDCADKTRACSGDRTCCDLSGFSPDLKAANGLCIPAAQCPVKLVPQ
jgi:hypothetical protein